MFQQLELSPWHEYTLRRRSHAPAQVSPPVPGYCACIQSNSGVWDPPGEGTVIMTRPKI
jgi:hypothetical protein